MFFAFECFACQGRQLFLRDSGQRRRDCTADPVEKFRGSTPECLVLCLQEIEIWGFEGALYEFTVVEFLLAHAEVLRKMTIHVQEEVTPDAAMRFKDQVLQYPRTSEACQVEIISTKNMEN
ncbi:hypothetical protein ACFX13_031509 [Malus domestica]